MKQFIQRFGDRLLGVLNGFDRLRFRGTLLWLSSEGGLREFLWHNDVLFQDFDDFVQPLTDRVRRAGERLAAQAPSRPAPTRGSLSGGQRALPRPAGERRQRGHGG